MTTQEHSGSVWDRLRHNRSENSATFSAAGIRPELVREVACPACGAEESALFWSAERRKGNVLYMNCPVCERATIRFNLARNGPVDPVFTRTTAFGSSGMLLMLALFGGAFYYRDTVLVQELMSNLFEVRERVVSQWRPPSGGYASPAPASSGTRAMSPRPSGSTSGSTAAPRSPGGGGRSAGSSPPRSSTAAAAPSGARFPAAARSGSAAPAAEQASQGEQRAEAAAGYIILVARGDRREELAGQAAEVAARGGTEAASGLLQVQYLPEQDQTRVVVDTSAVEWRRRLNIMQGWRRTTS